MKCLVHIISENLLKAISLMFETETLTLFSSEIEVGSHAPLPPTHPVITPLLFCLFLKLSKVFSVFLRKNTLIRKAFQLQERKSFIDLNPLIANPTKWSNTLKQFVDHLVKLALKGLTLNIFLTKVVRMCNEKYNLFFKKSLTGTYNCYLII